MKKIFGLVLVTVLLTVTGVQADAQPLSPDARAASVHFGMMEDPAGPCLPFTPGITRRLGSTNLKYSFMTANSKQATNGRKAIRSLTEIMNRQPFALGMTFTEVPFADQTAHITFIYSNDPALLNHAAVTCFEADPSTPGLITKIWIISNTRKSGSDGIGIMIHELIGHGFGVLKHVPNNGTVWSNGGLQYSDKYTPEQNAILRTEWQPVPGAYEVMRWIYTQPPGTPVPPPAQ
jgi:hypothetical protein